MTQPEQFPTDMLASKKVDKTSPSDREILVNTSTEAWINRNYYRRRGTVMTLAIVVASASSLISILTFWSYITGSPFSISGLFSLAGSILFWLSYAFARFKLGGEQPSVDIAGYILLLTMLTVLTLILLNISGTGSSATILTSLMLIPVLAVVLEVKTKGAWVTIAIGGVVLSWGSFSDEANRAAQIPAEGFRASVFITWLVVYGLIAAGVLVFAGRQRRFTAMVEHQAFRLGELIQTLQDTNDLGSNLSQNMAGITAELGSASRQHASSSQEQVAGINQATVSLEELSETASQIASSASSAATLADKTLFIGNSINHDTQLAQTTAEEGSQAVEDTIRGVERVRDRIELLAQRLLRLTEQNRRVSGIIDLIDEIADETHLLALNASIEAAGNIQMSLVSSGGALFPVGGSNTVRGERFGVIAQEIKNLADRSRESTEEVRQAIGEMQGSVAAAVLVAEESKKETAVAMTRSQIAGVVIQKLMQVISESSTRVEQILAEAEQVKNLCKEISFATNQQRSANQQILTSMRTIAELSQENAQIISQLAETVMSLNFQMDELNTVLSKSNRLVLNSAA